MKVKVAQQYMGDGVYIRTDGYHWILETDRNIVYLDFGVRRVLYELLRDEFEEREDA